MSQAIRTYSKETGLNTAQGRIPPQAKEIEESLLGVILTTPSIMEFAMESLTEDVFYVTANQRVFGACVKLFGKNKQTDMLSVIQQMKEDGTLEESGGAFYLSKLTMNISGANSFNQWCIVILDKYVRREIIKLSSESLNECYDESLETFDIIDSHEKKFTVASQHLTKERVSAIGELIMPVLNKIAKLRLNDTHITGIASGIRAIDHITRGWQPSDLIILAARPSVGKTAFALNLVTNAAKNGEPVAFFCLEMSSSQLVQRIMSAESGIELEKIASGRLTDEENTALEIASESISELPLFIDDSASLNIYEFRAKARRMARKKKVKLIVIDYLQLMSGSKDRNGNREQEISTISRNLKILAKDLNIPIIALSQLSRKVEERKESKIPMLSDLRESGAIEQDADLVAFLYRPDYYEQFSAEGESNQDDAFFKLAKHRNGALDIIALKKDLRIQKFYDPFDFEELQRNKQQSNWKPLNNHYHDDNLF